MYMVFCDAWRRNGGITCAVIVLLLPLANAQFGTIKIDWKGETAKLSDFGQQPSNLGACKRVPPASAAWDKIEGAVLGALIADALALRDHYEYSIERILPRGIIRDFADPSTDNLTPGWGAGPTCFHPKRVAGELTDYGDNVLWVLRSAVVQRQSTGLFEDAVYASHWVAEMHTHDGYVNMASRRTLAVMERNGQWSSAAAGDFGDFPGPARAAGLLPGFARVQELQEAARAVSGLTHADRLSWHTSALVAAVPHCLASSGEPLIGIGGCLERHLPSGEDAEDDEAARAVRDLVHSASDRAADVERMHGGWVTQAASARTLQEDDVRRDEIALNALQLRDGRHLGGLPKASPIFRVLPEAVYLALRYEADAEAGITANAMLGGDSAARATLVGRWALATRIPTLETRVLWLARLTLASAVTQLAWRSALCAKLALPLEARTQGCAGGAPAYLATARDVLRFAGRCVFIVSGEFAVSQI